MGGMTVFERNHGAVSGGGEIVTRLGGSDFEELLFIGMGVHFW